MGKWINCKKCGHEYFSSLSKCPECGNTTSPFKKLTGLFAGLLVSAAVVAGIIFVINDKGTEKPPEISSETYAPSSENKESSEQSTPSSQTDVVSSSGTSAYSSQTETSLQESSTPQSETPIIGSVRKDSVIHTTFPEYYLRYVYKLSGETEMSFEAFAYTLTDEDKSAGYTELIKNSDGSATFVIPRNKHSGVLADHLGEGINLIRQMEDLEYVDSVDHNSHFENFDVTLNTDTLSDEGAVNFTLLGLYFLENNYHTVNSSNKCTVNLIYPNGETQAIVFPDVIKY